MKVFLPSTGLPARLWTHTHFADQDLHAVVHDKSQQQAFHDATGLPKAKIHVSGAERFVSAQRQFLLEHLVEHGEWFVSADDNIRQFLGHAGLVLKPDMVWARIQETLEECKKRGAKFAGFATTSNDYFRKKHFRDVGYVLTKICLEQKTHLQRDLQVRAMDDYEWTGAHLKEFGRVLINNSMYAKAKHYEKGGIGTYQERLPQKLADASYLMKKYPGLFRYKKKANCHPEAELQIRFTNSDQVAEWRASNWGIL